MQNLWDACLRRLEQDLPAQQFNTWIRPLVPEAGVGDTLVLSAPNRFVLDLVRERFASRIERLAVEAGGGEGGAPLVVGRGGPGGRGGTTAAARENSPAVTPPTPH